MALLDLVFAAIDSGATPNWDAATAHINQLTREDLEEFESSGYETSDLAKVKKELGDDLELFRKAVEDGYRGMTVIFPRDLAVYLVEYDAPDFLYEAFERLRIAGVQAAAGFDG
jgi:hypothetical protein